jgi:alpha-mannosidase
VLLQQIYPVLGLTKTGISSATNPNDLIALNTLPWPRQELIEIKDAAGTSAVLASGTGVLLSISELSANQDRPVTIHEVSPGILQLQNSQLTVTVKDGCVTSLYDRLAKREVLSGPANKYVIFDDKPIYWQAWDVEVYHLETRQELPSSNTRILEDKPHRVSVVTETKISENSWIKTTIALSAAFEGQQSYVECEAEVEWRETMKFLKVEFPVSVRSSDASYETAFGITKRPTHYNTS